MTIKPALSLESIIKAASRRLSDFTPGKLFTSTSEYVSRVYRTGRTGVYIYRNGPENTFVKSGSIITLLSKTFAFDETQYGDYLKICAVGGSISHKFYYFSFDLKFLLDGKYVETGFYHTSNDPVTNIETIHNHLISLESIANKTFIPIKM